MGREAIAYMLFISSAYCKNAAFSITPFIDVHEKNKGYR